MRSLWGTLLCFAAALTAAGQTGGRTTGSVSGRVFCSDTQTPCRFATVTIETAPPADAVETQPKERHSYGGTTDLEGNFEIDNVADGDYYILAQLMGYLSPYDMAVGVAPKGSALSAKAVDAALSRITVVSGKATTANLALRRGAALAGTVRYDDGGLGINLPIMLYRQDMDGQWVAYANRVGDSSLAPLGFGAHTDDRGHFYEPGLPPGVYAVKVTLPIAEMMPQGIMGVNSLQVKITKGDALEVFSGNQYRLKDAAPVKFGEGDASEVDITIPITGLCSIHGNVTAKADRRPVTSGSVKLLDPADKSVLREADLDEDGDFDFRYVVAGSYLIEIESGEMRTGEGLLLRSGYQTVTAPLVVQGDIAALNYALTPAGKQ